MADFLSDELPPSLTKIEPDFVRPPMRLAVVAAVLGVASLVFPVAIRGRVDLLGWGLGFLAVITGVVYRGVLGRRQREPLYLREVPANRLMLIGVLLGFLAIVVNAYFVAQRTLP